MINNRQPANQPIEELPRLTITLDQISGEEYTTKTQTLDRLTREIFNDEIIQIRIVPSKKVDENNLYPRGTIFCIGFTNRIEQNNHNQTSGLINYSRQNNPTLQASKYQKKLLSFWRLLQSNKIKTIVNTRDENKILIEGKYPTPFAFILPATVNNREELTGTGLEAETVVNASPIVHPIQLIELSKHDLGWAGINYNINPILDDLTNQIKQNYAKQKAILNKISLVSGRGYSEFFDNFDAIVAEFKILYEDLKKQIADVRGVGTAEQIVAKIEEVNSKWQKTKIKDLVFLYPIQDTDKKESEIVKSLAKLYDIEQLTDEEFSNILNLLRTEYDSRIQNLVERYRNFVADIDSNAEMGAKGTTSTYVDPLIQEEPIGSAEPPNSSVSPPSIPKPIDFKEIKLHDYATIVAKDPKSAKNVLNELELLQKDQKQLVEFSESIQSESCEITPDLFLEQKALEYANNIKRYLDRPRESELFGKGHLSVFARLIEPERGKTRAQIYKDSLETRLNNENPPRYDSEKLAIIVFTLLSSSAGDQLRKDVVMGTAKDVEIHMNRMKDFLPFIFTEGYSDSVRKNINDCQKRIIEYVNEANGGTIPLHAFNPLLPPTPPNRQLSTRQPQMNFFAFLIKGFQNWTHSKVAQFRKIVLLDVYGTVINQDGIYNEPLLKALKSNQSNIGFKIILCASNYRIGDEDPFITKLILKEDLSNVQKNLTKTYGLTIESVLVDNSNQYELDKKKNPFGSYYKRQVEPIEAFAAKEFKAFGRNIQVLKPRLMRILRKQESPFTAAAQALELGFTNNNNQLRQNTLSSGASANAVHPDLKDLMIRHVVGHYTDPVKIIIFDDNEINIEAAQSMQGTDRLPPTTELKASLVEIPEEMSEANQQQLQTDYQNLIRNTFRPRPAAGRAVERADNNHDATRVYTA